MESMLKLYSLGIVVETKPPKTDMIMVSPIEVLNIQTGGDIKSFKAMSEGTLKNVDSHNFKSTISCTNYVPAKWMPLGHSNRITAPDVVANETVLLFKYGDVDEYFWTTIFREVELRRLEDVLYGFSNIPKGMAPFDKLTSYWMEVDTQNKKVHFHTAMNDKEYTEYDIVIDTKKGTLTITDKKKNYIHLDSPTDHITIKTNNAVTITTDNTVNINTGTLNINADIVHSGKYTQSGDYEQNGSHHATGTIIDDSGNTNHHGH